MYLNKSISIFSLFWIIVLFNQCYCTTKIDNKDEDILIQIKELNYSEPIGSIITITKNQLIIEHCLYVLNSCKNKKTVFHKQISNTNKAIFMNLLSNQIVNLDTLYQQQMLDGFRWKIECKYPQLKAIIIENKYVPQVDTLFEEINKLIPSNKFKLVKTSLFNKK